MTITVGPGHGESPAGSPPDARRGSRGFWPLRDLPVVFWLVSTFVTTLVHPFIPAPRWLMIHLLVLGAAGHAILVWSRYFADTLLRLPPTPRREQSQRLLLFNLGAVAVCAGVPSGLWWLVVAGGAAIVGAVGWHVVSLTLGLRTTLSSRFAFTLRFYLAAGLLLPVGIALGTWLARAPGEPLETRLRLAHVAINMLGWIGLTVLGTVVTLGPTMLRTRIVEGAETRTQQALWPLLGGIVAVVAAAGFDLVALVAFGLALYAVGVGMVGWPLARASRVKPPRAFPTWSVAAGLVWLFALLVVLAVKVALGVAGSGSAWLAAGKTFDAITPYVAAAFVAQVLLGALSYLIPVVMGGGPAAVRAMNRDLDAGGALRVSLTNLAILTCILPVPSVVRVLASTLALAALVAFVPILLRAVRRRHSRPGVTAPPAATERPRGQNTGLAAMGVALVMAAVAVGGAVDPAGLGGPAESAASGVEATGKTVEVTVEAKDMRFTPDTVEVNAGDRVVITVDNTDPVEVHDLVLETGHDSGRLAPGESATIDVGVVGRDLDGWCSVVGHRQMGMVMNIVAKGAPAKPKAGTTPTTSDDSGSTQHGSMSHDSMSPAEPSADAAIQDPHLAAIPEGRTHRYTFEVTEHDMEVAPGVVQEMWTYNGQSPGPTLRGRLGDTFVITLVNNGKSGHSIDFHAGRRAPDKVMRTISPGEKLVYRFTAERAGIWMYHCSSMPMSAHIANGLFGAVVIDPPELKPVDQEFVLVQSEHFYGPGGEPVDMDKLLAEKPDAVVFNGYANGYDHRPLQVKVGERVRIWLLNAGPNRPLSFHVVGGMFDTTYAEGSWLLGDAASPATTGGSQALALAAAQGGFVEMEFDEPGHYPLVNHVMIDAERGAHGFIDVTR